MVEVVIVAFVPVRLVKTTPVEVIPMALIYGMVFETVKMLLAFNLARFVPSERLELARPEMVAPVTFKIPETDKFVVVALVVVTFADSPRAIVPPRATDPPPFKLAPAFTVREELASIAFVTERAGNESTPVTAKFVVVALVELALVVKKFVEVIEVKIKELGKV